MYGTITVLSRMIFLIKLKSGLKNGFEMGNPDLNHKSSYNWEPNFLRYPGLKLLQTRISNHTFMRCIAPNSEIFKTLTIQLD